MFLGQYWSQNAEVSMEPHMEDRHHLEISCILCATQLFLLKMKGSWDGVFRKNVLVGSTRFYLMTIVQIICWLFHGNRILSFVLHSGQFSLSSLGVDTCSIASKQFLPFPLKVTNFAHFGGFSLLPIRLLARCVILKLREKKAKKRGSQILCCLWKLTR